MSAFDQLQRASFGAVEFPVRTGRCKGTFRHYEHVYLKTPGAATEKMGRGLYRFELGAVFDVNVPGYTNLWPGALSVLRRMYEDGTTADLTFPSIGTVPCWIPEWDQAFDMRVRSGETAQLIFQEDDSQAFLKSALQKVSSASVTTAQGVVDLTSNNITPRPSIFDKIQSAVNDVLSVVDQAELQQNLLAAKIEGVTELIREADRDVEALQDPANFAVVYALQDLLSSMIQLGKDVTLQHGEARTYTVPMTMSVAQISAAIYPGDPPHFNDIVANNRLDDPLKVIAGTKIFYFTG